MSNSIPFLKGAIDAAVTHFAVDANPASVAFTVGYCNGSDVESDGTLTVIDEPVGLGGYARVPVLNSQFSAAVQQDDELIAVKSNSVPVAFPIATADQGTFTHFIIRAGTGSVVLAVEEMGTPITVETGNAPSFEIGNLTLDAE